MLARAERAGRELPPLRGLGYRQVAGALRGDYDLDEAVRLARKATLAFVRRQTSWLRSEPDFVWVETAAEAESALRSQAEA